MHLWDSLFFQAHAKCASISSNATQIPHSMLNYIFTNKNIINRFVCIEIDSSISNRKHEPVHLTQAKSRSELGCTRWVSKWTTPVSLEEGWVKKRIAPCRKAFLPGPNKPDMWQADGMPRAASLSSICTPVGVKESGLRWSLAFWLRGNVWAVWPGTV